MTTTPAFEHWWKEFWVSSLVSPSPDARAAAWAAWQHRNGTQPEGGGKLTKPAQVGNTIFGVGIDERTVIERAQREHDYRQRPSHEAVRISQSNAILRSFHLEGALAELVELKGMKDALDDHAAGVKLLGEEWFTINEEYRRRKPRAWQRAREILAPGADLDEGDTPSPQPHEPSEGK